MWRWWSRGPPRRRAPYGRMSHPVVMLLWQTRATSGATAFPPRAVRALFIAEPPWAARGWGSPGTVPPPQPVPAAHLGDRRGGERASCCWGGRTGAWQAGEGGFGGQGNAKREKQGKAEPPPAMTRRRWCPSRAARSPSTVPLGLFALGPGRTLLRLSKEVETGMFSRAEAWRWHCPGAARRLLRQRWEGAAGLSLQAPTFCPGGSSRGCPGEPWLSSPRSCQPRLQPWHRHCPKSVLLSGSRDGRQRRGRGCHFLLCRQPGSRHGAAPPPGFPWSSISSSQGKAGRP